MTKIGLIQFLLLLLISAAYGQKVKYKDIYALLSTKQFEQAEPFLKNYLRETTDNPNAYLYMGNIFQEKASKNDILRQTRLAIANMDSAIAYFDKAHKSLDDREVRKNKEYYQSYNRRDLRTGEFGVKLSDIQFDLEKKIEGLKERIDKVKMVKYFFSLSDTLYQRSHALFVSIQNQFPSESQLYLRSDAQTVKDLVALSLRFDSCTRAFDQYRAASVAVGKTGYNQQMKLTPIIDFKVDGKGLADFYSEEVKMWDYKKFADKTREVIEKEIMPMRQHLVSYDMEINKLRERLNSDSVSVRSDLTRLIDKLLYGQLKKFDADPLPMLVFAMKTTDLAYRSTVLEHKPLRDSADIHLQMRMLNQEMNVLTQLDSAATRIPGEKVEEKLLDYADFINHTYGNAPALKRYLKTLREFGLREQKKKQALLDHYTKSLNYIVDGADSIPLSSEITSPFKPLLTTPEKFTLGLSLADTTKVQGYFYTINSARKPEVKALFPVDQTAFNRKNLVASKALVYSDAGGQIYYVLLYSGNKAKEKYPASLAKIYRSDGLAWKIDQPLAFTPNELILKPDTGELVITDGVQRVVVDKNGRVLR